MVDMSNVASVELELVNSTLALIVFNKNDGTQSQLKINKLDPIHSIMSAVCDRVDITDCNGVMDKISNWFYGVMYTPVLPHATLEDFTGSGIDVIRHIAQLYTINDYLEIGCNTDATFGLAEDLFPHAVGVDPNQGGNLRMTSDEFFDRNTEMFDLIFVDGLHEANQVFRDVHHALEILRPGKYDSAIVCCVKVMWEGGTILMHDANPRSRQIQEAEQIDGGVWSGDVWKAAVALRLRPDIEIVMVDVCYGFGVIKRRENKHPLPPEWIAHLDVNPISMLSYDLYEQHKHTLHRFMTLSDVRQWLNECAAEERVAGGATLSTSSEL